MKNPLFLIGFLLFNLAVLLSVGQEYDWFSFPEIVPAVVRWTFLAFLIYYGIKKNSLTTWILLSMIIGAEIGYDFPKFGADLDIFSKIFIKLIKTIIAPLLFSTLIIGIAGHSNLKQVGRMGLRALIYFEIVTTIALFVGLAAINFSQAGAGIAKPEGKITRNISPSEMTMKIDSSSAGVQLKMYSGEKQMEVLAPKKKDGWKEIVLHIFPDNIAKSIAEGQVLQVVVFSILFAIGMMFVAAPHQKTMLSFAESLAEIMFKFTGIIMYMAPFAIGGAIASVIATMGFGIMKNLGLLVLTCYGALLVFIGGVLMPIMLFLKIPIRKFFDAVQEPATLAFATASSEAALPLALQNMEKFGVPRKIVSFVLPTGYSFNLDGSTLYLSLATIFVAQAAGIHLPIGQQIIILLTLMLTSKGVAGVPRASLVILAGTCDQFGLPAWPIAIILGVDALMDMARTATNLIGNCLATAVIARWEKEGDF